MRWRLGVLPAPVASNGPVIETEYTAGWTRGLVFFHGFTQRSTPEGKLVSAGLDPSGRLSPAFTMPGLSSFTEFLGARVSGIDDL